MIEVLFFAQLREQLLCDRLSWTIAPGTSVKVLREQLAEQGERWQWALAQSQLLVAVNQQLTGWETELQPGDEVALFPPVTGG